MRDWVTNVENTFYIIGTVAGPHPYPMMVRDFQRVIGDECLVQMPEIDRPPARRGDRLRRRRQQRDGHLLSVHSRIEDVRLIGVEAAGEGLGRGRHAASLCAARPGVLHGNRTYLLQDANGQIIETHSVSRRPRLSRRRPRARVAQGHRPRRVRRHHRRRGARGVPRLCRIEGIIPALESATRVAYAMKLAPTMPKDSDPARQPLRPRRQGHAHGRRARGHRRFEPSMRRMNRIDATFAALASREAARR